MKHLAITQARPTCPPIVTVYLACTLPGCRNRFHLGRGRRLRALAHDAQAAGWHINAPGDERCPDHLPGRPLQLTAASLDPTDTVPDGPVLFNHIAAAAQYYADHEEP